MSELKILHTESGQQVVDYEYAKSLIEQQQAQIDELAATVERLNKEANALYDLAQDAGVCSEYLRVNFASGYPTPRQNLNAVKRDVAKEAILAAIEDYKREYCGQGIEALLSSFADIYPAQRYPDKE